MKVIIFNDTQNFNGSLNFINEKFKKEQERFWNYKKYIPFILKKVKSLSEFNHLDLQLVKTYFYGGKYSSKLIRSFKWSSHNEISKINKLITKEQNLLNMISQQANVSNYLRKKINQHVEEIKREFEEEKERYYKDIRKQERNFEGQKKLLQELEDNSLIDLRLTPLKQRKGEVYQKGVDVLLATDLIHLAHIDAFDMAIILSGDTDLIEAIKLVISRGKNVIIFSYHTPNNPKKSNISDLISVGKFINLRIFTNEEIEEMSDLKEDIKKSRQKEEL